MNDVVDAQRPAAESKDHSLSIDLPHDPATVEGVGAVLAQSVTDLINNAIKYTPQGGSISVRVRPDGDDYEFSVTDTGFGIPDEAKDQLFRPLSRVGSRETRRIAGTGFGLYLVKRIVERHGGSVFFTSVLGRRRSGSACPRRSLRDPPPRRDGGDLGVALVAIFVVRAAASGVRTPQVTFADAPPGLYATTSTITLRLR
ncbi:MAG: ATP-binding protein [Chloroflexi bacterium]|nr:ATP-binding protein [Chloroflexota bacterium]